MGIQEKLLARRKTQIKASDISDLERHENLLAYIKPVFGGSLIKAVPFRTAYDTSFTMVFRSYGFQSEAEKFAKAIAKKFVRDWGFKIEENLKKDFATNVLAVSMHLVQEDRGFEVYIESIANMDNGSLNICFFSW